MWGCIERQPRLLKRIKWLGGVIGGAGARRGSVCNSPSLCAPDQSDAVFLIGESALAFTRPRQSLTIRPCRVGEPTREKGRRMNGPPIRETIGVEG